MKGERMKAFRVFTIFLLVFWIACFAAPVGASEAEDLFVEDRISLQGVSGLIYSSTFLTERPIDMHYWQTNLRLGRMLGTPSESDSFFRGNWEALLEITNSSIFKGSGHYIGGITGLLRYNFVQPDAKVIPYFQAGLGVVYNDVYKDMSQIAIGQAIEFTPQGSLGVHFLLSEHWSFDTEAIFHHISNANLNERNGGVNAFGGFIGFTRFFDKLWK
ncbi:MAG: acyloxyacyl hydrolase [Desulfobacteraceae bacterium]|nr:MAG: acyloxyacyl hydrolase [Desulfobacteraceae bacterium]